MDLRLSWPDPAASWHEATPVGNGRLGAMVFGGTRRARWQLNDATVWSGTPATPYAGLAAVRAAGAGPDRLAEIRRAIRSGDRRHAEALLMAFEGDYSQEFLPCADLWLALPTTTATYHHRHLNLDTGTVDELLDLDGHRIHRRTFASHPAGALCIALTAEDAPLDPTVDLSSPLREDYRESTVDGVVLGLAIPVDGAPQHEPTVDPPLRYADGPDDTGYDPFAAIAVRVVDDGHQALITVASSTSAEDAWARSPALTRKEHLERAARRATAAIERGLDELLDEHERDMRRLLGGTRVTIGGRGDGVVDVAGEVLSGDDERLTATVLVAWGRYLLAAASRPGGPPANLQGIWNGDLRPAWSSNYTTNINTEMNYWGAEPGGLSECHLPLFDLLDRLAVTGADVARDLYGAGGWVVHHNTDPWGWALPVGMGHSDPSWAIWPMGGVWLAHHLLDHADFTRDEEFLAARAGPLLRGCVRFCLDFLEPGPDGWLDTIPSTSPENTFLDAHGGPESLTWSSALDMALVRGLFERCLDAAGGLGFDAGLTAELRAALPRLRPPAIGADGRLREWAEDVVEADPRHRHLSPLAPLYPLDGIDPERTPELAAAASRLLDTRGPGTIGWSWAWKIALRARLGQAGAARDLLREASRPYREDGSGRGGLLPNLFSAHPPFQIDGSYGLLAAILELLVDSHGGTIRLLPAVPAEWPDGTARGIAARGGWLVDLAWRGGDLTGVTVRHRRADRAGTARLAYRGRTAAVPVAAGGSVALDGRLTPGRAGAGA